MDRGMKLMFGMMTAAICLMAINMFGNNTSQAYAANVVDRGGSEPTIVSFRVTEVQGPAESVGVANVSSTHFLVMWRMWSDGAVEVNLVGEETIPNGSWNSSIVTQLFNTSGMMPGWVTVPDSVAGYACAGDGDGNRMIDVIDLVAVITEWGPCEEAPPVNLPPDMDLF